MKYPFPKAFRLLTRRSFFLRGNPQKMGRFLIIDMKKTMRPHARLGLTVSKKYGCAAKRNRFKRLVREAFRLNPAYTQINFDLNVRPRAFAKEATFLEIEEELKKLLSNT